MSDEQHKLLKAEKFQLVDEAGRVRARLGLTGGGPLLALFDETGKARAELRVLDGQPSLCLNDEGQTKRASLSLGKGGLPSVLLFDETGTPYKLFGDVPDARTVGPDHLDEAGEALFSVGRKDEAEGDE